MSSELEGVLCAQVSPCKARTGFKYVSGRSRFVFPPLSLNYITEYYFVFIVVSHVCLCLCDGNHGHHFMLFLLQRC